MTQPSHPPFSRREFRTLWLASLGGALEFYDFVVFVFFAGIIGKLFFPGATSDWIRQVQTFSVFAVGYIARPIGGIVLAHFGDRYGRKKVFTLSILLMALPTLLIGFLPTYGQVGVFAPVLLIALRVVQGIAIGGEAPGGWVYVAEHAPQRRRGFAIGLLTAGLSFGILLGSLVATAINRFASPADIAAKYWRLPFLLGGVLGVIAVKFRRGLQETPVFVALRNTIAQSSGVPLRVILKEHLGAVWIAAIVTWALTAVIVVEILMTPTLLQRDYGISPLAVQASNLLGTALLCVSTVTVGALADRFGLRKLLLAVGPLFLAATYALYIVPRHHPGALPAVYALVGATAGLVTLAPLLMVELFPAAVRFTGVSFSYNVSYAIWGGITPPLVAWISHYNRLGPAHYVLIATVTGAIALLITQRATVGASQIVADPTLIQQS